MKHIKLISFAMIICILVFPLFDTAFAQGFTAMPAASGIFDGKQMNLTAYSMNGNNYFKLRDLAAVVNSSAEWDSLVNRIVILTDTILARTAEQRMEILNSTSNVTITGKNYYVSNAGDDKNDGRSPDTAWATIAKVNETAFADGDGVFFERGGFFRGALQCAERVTYSAYGSGAKPVLADSPENGSGSEKWTLYLQGNNGEKIWKYHQAMPACGNIVFDDGAQWGFKCAPSWNGTVFINRKTGRPFDVGKELDRDLMFLDDAVQYWLWRHQPI